MKEVAEHMQLAVRIARSYMYGMPWHTELDTGDHGVKRGAQILCGNFVWTVTDVDRSSCIVVGKPGASRVWISNINHLANRFFCAAPRRADYSVIKSASKFRRSK